MPHVQTITRRRYLTGASGVLLLALIARYVVMGTLPAFIDEGWHLFYASEVLNGNTFIAIYDGRWLYTLLLAAFHPTGPESLWLAREVSVLSSLLTVAAVIGLGRLLADRRVGLLAGLLYALLPLALFHERQALSGPPMVAFATLATVLMVRLARRPRLWLVALLSVSLAVAFLLKSAAVPFLALPLAAALILPRRWPDRWRALVYGLGASAAAYGLTRLVTWQAALHGAEPSSRHSLTLDNTYLPDLHFPAVQALLRRNVADVGATLWALVGPLLLLLVALALVGAIRGRHRRAALFLLLPAFAILGVPLLARLPGGDQGRLLSRFVLPGAPALVVLAALGARGAWRIVSDRLAVIDHRGLAALGTGLLIAPSLVWTVRFATDPYHTPLPPADEQFYVTFTAHDALIAEASADLLADLPPGERLNVLTFTRPYWQYAYLGADTGDYVQYVPESADTMATVAGWLAAGERVAVIDYGDTLQEQRIPPDPYGLHLSPPRTYRGRMASVLAVHEVLGAEPPIAPLVAAQAAPDLAHHSADVDALLAELNGIVSPPLVYPASSAARLATHTDQPIIALTTPHWPLDAAAARQIVSGALADARLTQRVDVVTVSEDATDPTRALRLALLDQLYWLSDRWYGPLHLTRYVNPGQVVPLRALDVWWEDAIVLAQAGLLPPNAPGGYLPVTLIWRTTQPIQDSFKVFVHVLDQDGALVAQNDLIPGAGLKPMPGWTPGERITDRVAVALSSDLPPGTYSVRVGIYRPDNHLRLRVTAGGDAPDSALLGTFTLSQN